MWLPVLLLGCATGATATTQVPQRPAAKLAPIVVTATPLANAIDVAPRAVSVITRADIEASPAQNLDDLLAEVAGVDIRRRGGPGVQADLGIRGSNFEQTLVLIDGVPIGNPQTGHHNLDIPVPLAHVQRIEIIKGPGAIQYGGATTGGVINIVTRAPHQPMASFAVTVGSHASREVAATLGSGTATSSHLLSATTVHADSENPDQPTDADLHSALYTGGRQIDNVALDWGLGASHKAFGAWAFYSADFPDARERTASRLAWFGADAPLGDWRASVRVYWNGHDDWFRTRIASKDYINRHATDSTGFETDLRRIDAHGATVVGANFGHDSLRSNALADHQRSRTSWWIVRQQRLATRLTAELGLNRVRYQRGQEYWLPSLALAWHINANWRAFASAAESARAPSWTELDLATAANRGNPNLLPERSHQVELGIAGDNGTQHFEATLFDRRTRHLIDWVRAPGSTTWVAANLDGYHGRGGELGWRWRPTSSRIEELGIEYTHLDVTMLDRLVPVKYALQVPTNTWLMHARLHLVSAWQFSVDVRRPEYGTEQTATLASMRLAWRHRHWRAWLSVANAFNQRIIETGFAPIAGRWYYAGFGYDL